MALKSLEMSPLSEKEKIVLSSLVANPSYSDIEIASNVGIKKSTFATIKKKLFQRKLFKKYYIPNFADLNAEIFSITIREVTDFSAEKISPGILKDFQIEEGNENIILIGMEANIAIAASIVRNYSDLVKNQWKFERIAKNLGMLFKFQHNLAIPILFSNFYRVLDFSISLPRHLGVDTQIFQFEPLFRASELNLSITKLGWEIYLAFLKNPGFSPKEIASTIKRPRTTTTRWLRTFLQTRLLTPRILPNIQKIGYKICLITQLEVLSTLPTHFTNICQIIDKTISPEFLVQSNTSIFVISMFGTFDDVRQAEDDFLRLVETENINFKTKYRFIFSLPHTHFFLTLDNSLADIAKNLGIPRISTNE
jgi:predicted transcriptional regulator